MAAGTLPKPGTELGPCGPHTESCQHTDCQLTREMAKSPCHWCGEAVGYETRFYKVEGPTDAGGYVHAACEEDAIDEGRI